MTAGPRFCVGDRILIVAGMSRGLVGRIVGPSIHRWDGDHVWAVRLDAEPQRDAHIREEMMAPEPSESDEDVMGPLRRVRCP